MKNQIYALAVLCGGLLTSVIPLHAQSMTADNLEGPVTSNEITSFKNYINAVQPNTWTTVDNMANELAQYVTGQRLKAMGQMYELTGDVAILNRMIYFCDVVLSERNDILAAPYGQHVMWTGTITHDWIQSQTDANATGNATSGDGAGHLAYCAHLILQHTSLLTQTVPDNDVYGHGTTYGDRAATFLAEADDVYSTTMFPYELDLTSHANRLYWMASVPNFSGAIPWNQQAMCSWGMMHAAAAHVILGDNPTLVTKYDGIVSTALSWLFTDSTSHLNYTDSAGNAAMQWGYSPSSYTSSIEDNSHGSLDTAWLYRCYTLGRYGLTSTQMQTVANTLADVMLLGPKWMAGNVNGATTGSGNSGATTYVRDGWYLLTDWRPDKYYNVVTTGITPGSGTTNIGAFANFLWVKNNRHVAGYSVAFNPSPTGYTTAQTVTLTSLVSGANIRYTTDGSTPTTTTGTLYSAPFSVSQTTTVKAIAYTGSFTSPVSTATYTIWAATPSASPAAGTYVGTQSVTLSTTTPGATIRYTTDKTTPTPTSGTIYTGAISVSASKTIRAIAYTSTLSSSDIRTAVYTINASATAATPAFSPAGGTYTSTQSVTISSLTSGASLYYTTDGSTPTTSSTLYTGPVSVSSGETLSALAVASGYNNSAIGSADYTIGATSAPTLSLSSGTYTGQQTVTISSDTAGATIIFTLDGSTPSATNGYLYTGPFTIKQNTTVKVYAYSDLHTDSVVTTGTYNIAAAAPTISPGTGTYNGTQSVTIATTTTGATIRYTVDGTTPTEANGTVYSSPIAIAASTTLKAIAYASGLTDSSISTATYTINATALPAGWVDLDIGSPALAGSATYTSGTYTVKGEGTDIYGTADQFHYAYTNVSGDVTLTARVATQTNTNAWAKSGVMIRETTAANSTYVGLYLTPTNGVDMQYRTTTGGSAADLARSSGKVAPYWLRLVRSGSTFTGYASPDGVTWTQIGSTTVTMATAVTVGLPVCSHNTASLNTTTFDNVSAQTNLAASFTREGLVTDGTVFTGGGLDGSGYAMTATVLGASLGFNGATFTFGPANANNAISCAAQVVALPNARFAKLQMLATGVKGSQASQVFTVTYTDGTMQSYTQSLSDWASSQSYAGETIAKAMTYRDTASGGTDARTINAYGYAFALNPAKTVKTVTLPTNANVEVLALTLTP